MDRLNVATRLTQWPEVALASGPMAPAEVPTGQEIRRAREARRWTQEELARELGVGTRSIGRWERGEAVPRSAIGALQQVLGLTGATSAQPPHVPSVTEASDAELIAEIARRLAQTRTEGDMTPVRPPERLRWPKSSAPSQRRTTQKIDDAKKSGETHA